MRTLTAAASEEDARKNPMASMSSVMTAFSRSFSSAKRSKSSVSPSNITP